MTAARALLLSLCGQALAGEFTLVRWESYSKSDCSTDFGVQNRWVGVCYAQWGAEKTMMVVFNPGVGQYETQHFNTLNCSGAISHTWKMDPLTFNTNPCTGSTKNFVVKNYTGNNLQLFDMYSDKACTNKAGFAWPSSGIPGLLDFGTPCSYGYEGGSITPKRWYCKNGQMYEAKFKDADCTEKKSFGVNYGMYTADFGKCGEEEVKKYYVSRCPSTGGPPVWASWEKDNQNDQTSGMASNRDIGFPSVVLVLLMGIILEYESL
jgi:hypothetical protein